MRLFSDMVTVGCASLDRPASTPARVPSPSSRADPLSVAGFAHRRSLGMARLQDGAASRISVRAFAANVVEGNVGGARRAAADLEPDGLPVGLSATPHRFARRFMIRTPRPWFALGCQGLGCHGFSQLAVAVSGNGSFDRDSPQFLLYRIRSRDKPALASPTRERFVGNLRGIQVVRDSRPRQWVIHAEQPPKSAPRLPELQRILDARHGTHAS